VSSNQFAKGETLLGGTIKGSRNALCNRDLPNREGEAINISNKGCYISAEGILA